MSFSGIHNFVVFTSVYHNFDIIIGLLIGWCLDSNDWIEGWFINYINRLNYNQ